MLSPPAAFGCGELEQPRSRLSLWAALGSSRRRPGPPSTDTGPSTCINPPASLPFASCSPCPVFRELPPGARSERCRGPRGQLRCSARPPGGDAGCETRREALAGRGSQRHPGDPGLLWGQGKAGGWQEPLAPGAVPVPATSGAAPLGRSEGGRQAGGLLLLLQRGAPGGSSTAQSPPEHTLGGAQGGSWVCFVPGDSHTSGQAGEVLVSCLGNQGAVSVCGAALIPPNPRGRSQTQDPISKPQQPSG